MKWNCRWATAPLSLGLALGALLLQAQSQPAPPAPAATEASAGPQDPQKPRVFVGKVVKTSNGQYGLLTDEQSGKGVLLDDQEKAKGFEGKSVKVSGVLEASKNLVHVSDIQLP